MLACKLAHTFTFCENIPHVSVVWIDPGCRSLQCAPFDAHRCSWRPQEATAQWGDTVNVHTDLGTPREWRRIGHYRLHCGAQVPQHFTLGSCQQEPCSWYGVHCYGPGRRQRVRVPGHCWECCWNEQAISANWHHQGCWSLQWANFVAVFFLSFFLSSLLDCHCSQCCWLSKSEKLLLFFWRLNANLFI